MVRSRGVCLWLSFCHVGWHEGCQELEQLFESEGTRLFRLRGLDKFSPPKNDTHSSIPMLGPCPRPARAV